MQTQIDLFMTSLQTFWAQVALFMPLEQLAIGSRMLTLAFAIVFGGLVLALALAFGLGGREWAAERIRAWHQAHPPV